MTTVYDQTGCISICPLSPCLVTGPLLLTDDAGSARDPALFGYTRLGCDHQEPLTGPLPSLCGPCAKSGPLGSYRDVHRAAGRILMLGPQLAKINTHAELCSVVNPSAGEQRLLRVGPECVSGLVGLRRVRTLCGR